MYVGHSYCPICKQETQHHGPSCDICAEEAAVKQKKKRRMDLAALKGLTLEERIERIEIQLYDLNIKGRIEALEAQNAKY